MILSETWNPSNCIKSAVGGICVCCGDCLCLRAQEWGSDRKWEGGGGGGVADMESDTYNFQVNFSDGQTTWKECCIAMEIRCQHLMLSLSQMFRSVVGSQAAQPSKWLHWHLLKHWPIQRSSKRCSGKDTHRTLSFYHFIYLYIILLRIYHRCHLSMVYRVCKSFDQRRKVEFISTTVWIAKCLCLIFVLLIPFLSLSFCFSTTWWRLDVMHMRLCLCVCTRSAVTRRKRLCVKEPNMSLPACLVALWIN